MRRSLFEIVPADADATIIVYDGECPICSQLFERYLKARSQKKIVLVDARNRPDVVAFLRYKYNVNLDNDVAVGMGESVYFGGTALFQALSLKQAPSKHDEMSQQILRVLYPVLRLGRRILLRILGVSPIVVDEKLRMDCSKQRSSTKGDRYA